MRRVLFLCSQNRLRSPTAERIFSSWPGIEVASAGLDASAGNPVTPELLDWADLIFVMELSHRAKLSKRFRPHLRNQRIICLNIPDRSEYMDPQLIELLQPLVPRYLPKQCPTGL